MFLFRKFWYSLATEQGYGKIHGFPWRTLGFHRFSMFFPEGKLWRLGELRCQQDINGCRAQERSRDGHLTVPRKSWDVPSGYVNIAIEHGHLLWALPLKVVIFHSYVSLPEGIVWWCRIWRGGYGLLRENRGRIMKKSRRIADKTIQTVGFILCYPRFVMGWYKYLWAAPKCWLGESSWLGYHVPMQMACTMPRFVGSFSENLVHGFYMFLSISVPFFEGRFQLRNRGFV